MFGDKSVSSYGGTLGCSVVQSVLSSAVRVFIPVARLYAVSTAVGKHENASASVNARLHAWHRSKPMLNRSLPFTHRALCDVSSVHNSPLPRHIPQTKPSSLLCVSHLHIHIAFPPYTVEPWVSSFTQPSLWTEGKLSSERNNASTVTNSTPLSYCSWSQYTLQN